MRIVYLVMCSWYLNTSEYIYYEPSSGYIGKWAREAKEWLGRVWQEAMVKNTTDQGGELCSALF